jgi:beta-1,4-mannosyltransferase
LVLSNCVAALKVLEQSALPQSRYVIEVVTDKLMSLPSWVSEIVVPSDYSPPNGCKYKARALNYAVTASSARPNDWIVHLDEETRFDSETLENIFAHCQAQAAAIETGPVSSRKRWPSVGQGVIYYNHAGIENYLTALADTIRVADDYSKFALQYRVFEFPLIGMHGSFVVARNSLEMEFGWDWGMVGSITEDTYLAMKMASQGVHFKWMAGNMYEQSPFSCLDFAKQRARWFSGLWLCVFTPTLPMWQRAYLGTHLVSWTACPFLTFLTWLNLLTIFPRSTFFISVMSVVFAVPFWSYCLGFVLGVRACHLKHGWVEWVLLLLCHVSLIPVYTIMETYGVLRGVFDRSTYTQFHVVKKEGQNVAKEAQINQATVTSQTNALSSQTDGISQSSCLEVVPECPPLNTVQHKQTMLSVPKNSPRKCWSGNDLVYLNEHETCSDTNFNASSSSSLIRTDLEKLQQDELMYWCSLIGNYPESLDLVADLPRKQVNECRFCFMWL